MITLKPLFNLMRKRNLTLYYLTTQGLDSHTADRIRKGGNISMRTLDKLCAILNCDITDIISYQKDKPQSTDIKKQI